METMTTTATVSFFGAKVIGNKLFDKLQVEQVIEKYFPAHIRRKMHDFGICIYILSEGETYSEASPELRRLGLNVDSWSVPPAGLFVVADKTLYLRTLSEMIIVHEYSHALDLTLGGNVYLSFYDKDINDAFCNAKRFITPYAATGRDEFFAESVRGFVGANDPASCWPVATPERLRKIDPFMYLIIKGIFESEGA